MQAIIIRTKTKKSVSTTEKKTKKKTCTAVPVRGTVVTAVVHHPVSLVTKFIYTSKYVIPGAFAWYNCSTLFTYYVYQYVHPEKKTEGRKETEKQRKEKNDKRKKRNTN